jgi:EAL domain-containing protein (putative c-di-GMP-specific phosphodiesterase class I)/AmiR/NasT family two-component response regulator
LTPIANLNLLVVEDDDFQRRWLVAMLANLGAKEIIEVADGAAALQILLDKKRRVDVAFMDLNMPGMDGMELIRHLAQENHKASIVIASDLESSLLFSVETMAKAFGIDMLGIIESPATPDVLQALLASYKTPDERQESRVAAKLSFTFADLQQGLKDREFEPLFQPKVELATGQIKGVEAFARWHHPKYGVVSPDAFIAAVEENGQMDDLAWIMIEKCAAAWRQWHEQGLELAIAINLSPSSLAKQGFADRICAYFARQEIEPHHCIVEITESAMVRNMPYFLENVARLRINGFGLAVDDYGMGHTSMQELMRIPFTELKIDRMFVAGASQNEALELVLSSSLNICNRLNRHSVAVGIETQQDWDFLHKLGCNYAQGHYIARPMEAGAIPAWVDEWSHFF